MSYLAFIYLDGLFLFGCEMKAFINFIFFFYFFLYDVNFSALLIRIFSRISQTNFCLQLIGTHKFISYERHSIEI